MIPNAPGEEEDEREEQQPAPQPFVGLGHRGGERGDAALAPDVGERLGVEVADRDPAEWEDDKLL